MSHDRRALPDISSYLSLIHRFISGDISAASFSKAFMRELKSEKRLLGDPVYPPLQELFEDSDAYVEYENLRTQPEDLDDRQLYRCAIRTRDALRDIGYE